tara:strand:- start:15272 stop:16024 length:753 start_codon:yes stop_codon:yes gene_type:complete
MNIQQIETFLDQVLAGDRILYNVDFVELKSRLNSLLEKAHDAAQAEYLKVIHTPGHERSAELQDQYYGTIYPHTLAGWTKKLPKTASPAFLNALGAFWDVSVQFTPACEKFLKAKLLVVKTRKPSERPRTTPERTLDNTGACACCSQNVKLDRGLIVAHGYTIRWGFQSGSCFGVGYLPIEVSDEGLRGALQAYERQLATARLALEYSPCTRRERADLEGRISGSKSAIAHYAAAIKVWALKALPSERKI